MGGRGQAMGTTKNKGSLQGGAKASTSGYTYKRTTGTVPGHGALGRTTIYKASTDFWIYKDGGGRYRVYDTYDKKTHTQATANGGRGRGDLTFNTLKSAKKYAENYYSDIVPF